MDENDNIGSNFKMRGFEKLIADISSDFIKVKYELIDDCIQRFLEILAHYSGIDRSYIFLFNDSNTRMSNTHEWCRSGIHPFRSELQNISLDSFPWFKDEILKLQTVSVSDVSKLDGNTVLVKQEWEREGIKSIVCVPMVCNEVLVGFIGFDTVLEKKKWSEDTIDFMKIAGGIFASAIVRKRTDKKLHESEQMLRAVLDSMPVRVFWKDTNSVYLGGNKSFSADAGLSGPKELVGKTDYDFFRDRKDSDFYRLCDRRVMDNDKPELGIIETQLRPDGHVAHLRTNKVPLHDDNGNVVGILGSYVDITADKKAENELYRAKFCIDHAADAVFWISRDGTFFYVNGEACRSLGYSAAELLNMSVCDIDAGIAQEDFDTIWQLIKKNGTAFFESRHITKDGRKFPVEVSVNFYEFDGKECTVSFVRDISRRKRTQEAIQNLYVATSSKIGESCINALIETLCNTLNADCVFIGEIDRESKSFMTAKYVYLDGSISASMHCTLKGTPYEDVVESRTCCYASGVKDMFPDCQVLQKLGIEGYIGVPLYDSKKELIGIQAVLYREPIQDVDYAEMVFTLFAGRVEAEVERLLIEKEREQILHSLQSKTEELESIVYVSSHDLRTPLVSIQGFSGELKKSFESVGRYINAPEMPVSLRSRLGEIFSNDISLYLNFVSKNADKMEELLDGLLKLSRIGRAELRITHVDMNARLAEIIEAMNPYTERENVEISIAKLPDCRADTGQLDQLFIHLIDNAIKFCDRQRKCTVKITGTNEEDMSVYCIEDNGIGIAEEYLNNIFEIFHRLDPDGDVQGEGLGLAIVKRIAARHKGRVWGESQLGEGSKFFVSLPKA